MGDIRITMLGSQASGKTCYMLGMYNRMQIGLNGFTMSMDDLDESLRLEQLWFKLIEGGEDRWPMLTNSAANYELSLNYGFLPMMTFSWLDYRGGALGAYSSDADKQALVQSLVDSKCIFLTVSGDLLRDGLMRSANVKQLELKQMNSLVTMAMQQIKPTLERPFPLVILITKYDLCASRGMDAIVNEIRQFFTAAFAQGKTLTAIIPVSLGKELADHQFTGAIEVINMHLPVVYAVWSQFMDKNTVKQGELQSSAAALREREAHKNLLAFFRSSDIVHQRDTVRALEAEASEIAHNMQLLVKELKDVQVYRGGERVEI
ncbi:MAG: hypothetical protein ACHQ1E_00660 [Ktedonobacterales bacterium]